MDTILINPENSKISEHHVFVLKLSDKLDLRRGQKTVHTIINEAHTIIINLKYLLQSGVKNLSYQMDHILYQIFKIILNIF